MESHRGDVCFDLRGICVYTQPAFADIGHHTATGANVDVSERLYPPPGVEAALGNAESAVGFLRGTRHARPLLKGLKAAEQLLSKQRNDPENRCADEAKQRNEQ